MSCVRYNENFIEILGELKDIMTRQGEPFRSRAYQKAQDAIMVFSENINEPAKQLQKIPGIGPAILGKLEEYVETGTIAILEKERNNPINLFTEIHGIGPKKAQELINANIVTLDGLRKNQGILNDIQKIGLKYYDDIKQRIPRAEIDEFYITLGLIFEEYTSTMDIQFDIVGSYRRGLETSGDIDIIITSSDGNPEILNIILNRFIDDGTIVEVLSRGKIKSMVIAKINHNSPARRIDFLYSPPIEYAFAVLYFTGSKIFNTIIRQRALDIGYTLNEHGLSQMVKGVKGNKIDGDFPDEKSILNFLGMDYIEPEERNDGRSVKFVELAPLDPSLKNENESLLIKVKKNTTLKKEKIVSTIELYIEKFKSEGINVLKMMTEKELNKVIRVANDAYYSEEEDVVDGPIMSDNLYDILREYVLEKYPNNTIAKEGHAKCNDDNTCVVQKNKVKLPYELWSMDKIKPDGSALLKWTNKYDGPYVISCKLDGISALYISGDGGKLYTRGNGTYGQDISHLIPSIIWKNKSINSFETDFVIRGEIIIKKDVFNKKYKDKFANPRNFVAGIVNKKTIVPEVLVDLEFVPYEVINPVMKPSEQMKFIQSEWNMLHKPVQYTVYNTISNSYLSELLLEWRENSVYEIDGLVIIDDRVYSRPEKNPEYAFAFKMVISDQVVETKVVDVLWTASKDGYLKPRVRIDPIVLGGVKIEYATGFNAKFIQDNKIGIGAVVSIVRSGDVIPHIISVVVPAETAMMPFDGSYEWNDTNVDIMLINKDDNSVVRAKNITGFFKGIEVDGIGAGNVARIIKAGYDTVPLIISMTFLDYLKVEGFKTKLATKIMNSIKEKVDGASLGVLMAASNIFGRGFGEKRFDAILKVYPDILVSDIGDKEKIKMVSFIEGFAGKTAEKFVNKIPKFVEFMNEAGLEGSLYNVNNGEKAPFDGKLGDNPLKGKKIVMTGFRDKELIDKIKAVGGDIVGSVSKNTFVVLIKDKDEDTGKAEQARQLSIPLLTPEEFNKKYFS